MSAASGPGRVAIVGGGIGGLCAAALLRQRGIEAVVFEQAPAFREVGAGLQVSPNGVKVLRSLGLGNALDALGVRPQNLVIRGWKTGIAISRTGIQGDFDRAYGAPYYHVHRADLHQMLLGAVAPSALQVGRRLTSMDMDDGNGEVTLGFGEDRARFDAVIGADGIHSAVRRFLHGDESPRFTGNVAFRAMVPVDDALRREVARDSTIWVGPGGHVVHYYVRGGSLLNIVAVQETTRWADESWTQEAERGDLLQAFAGWNKGLLRILERAEQCNRWALYDRDPLPAWGRGRATLLGDAAHPMLPFLAQGAVMAMEDAFLLAESLAAGSDVAQSLRTYEGARIQRTGRIQLAARARGHAMHVGSARESLRRNATLFFNSRMKRDEQIERGQSLYGYDVAKMASKATGSRP